MNSRPPPPLPAHSSSNSPLSLSVRRPSCLRRCMVASANAEEVPFSVMSRCAPVDTSCYSSTQRWRINHIQSYSHPIPPHRSRHTRHSPHIHNESGVKRNTQERHRIYHSQTISHLISNKLFHLVPLLRVTLQHLSDICAGCEQ